MKKSRLLIFPQALSFCFLGVLLSSSSLWAGVQEAEMLSQGLRDAKAKVDQLISQVSGNRLHSMVEVMADNGSNNDGAALPILTFASGSLFQAAENSDQSKAAFLGGFIAFGNYKFSMACMQTGISRSQVSRARTAALQPPVGFLAGFGPELAQIVVELWQLKLDVSCP